MISQGPYSTALKGRLQYEREASVGEIERFKHAISGCPSEPHLARFNEWNFFVSSGQPNVRVDQDCASEGQKVDEQGM